MVQRVIGLLGLPGAPIGKVVKHLEREHSAMLCWPGQDLQIEQARQAYERGENLELTRMHESILGQTGKSWFTVKAPRYYDVPYPGPEEYLSMFPGDATVIVGDYRLALFFPIWNRFIDHLFVCSIKPEQAANQIQTQQRRRYDLALCRDVVEHYRVRMHETVTAAMDRYTRIPEWDLQGDGYRQHLDAVLKSTF